MNASQEQAPSVVVKALPRKLEHDFLDKYEKLSCEQVGHLRHFHNLATQRDGDWSLMGSQDPGQEWLDSYRYQLATMAYAAGAAHYHRLPVLRSAFKALMESLIKKMLRREVWGYWFLTSHSGKFVDPDIKELRKPWADPIVKENIMYSGHLLLMVSLYTMLFNDDKYNEEEALTFVWDPIFWGMGPERFSYNRQSMQKAILVQMERENWLGVCCEPNSIFIVCNQFPIIALRYNDVRDGTNVAEQVIAKYTAAWKDKGMTQDDGLFIKWYSPRQESKRREEDVGFTAWAAAFMNAWNPSVALDTFKTQASGFLSWVKKDQVNVNPGPTAFAIRNLAREGADPYSLATLRKAQEMIRSRPASDRPEPPFPRPLFGYVIKWVSEVGDQRTLDGLITHADRYLNPTWKNGGLYYALNEQRSDEDGNWTEVEPFTGNGAIGYARLNVLNGQRKMWVNPWTPEYVSTTPYVDGISLASGVDFLRGCWDKSRNAMVVTMRSWDATAKNIRLGCCNMPLGRYCIYLNGDLSETHEVATNSDTVYVSLLVTGEELDLILIRE